MTEIGSRTSGHVFRRHAARAAIFLATTALTSPLLIDIAIAQNLPTGGSVAAGSAVIAQPSATQLNITQSSQSAVVNWQGFSVGQGSAVNIAQPNASSAILNRVTGNTSSNIAGSITANGSVYLVNPNGIAITPSGTVNAGGGFVASTLGISDSDFMSGKRTFTGNGSSAGVSNAGTISVGRGGYAALIGGTVSNAGSINVPLGKVGLGSGEQATLDFSGDGFLQVAVPTAAGGRGALVRNSGSIKADGGSVIISAATAREAARNAINISGTVQARSISGSNGSITIGGGAGGRVKVTGRLDASSATGNGGRIAVTGRDIKLKGATVDASGATGGGGINIGGGRQGQGPLQRAQTTTIDAATTIKADATQSGNGGNVVVWSDNLTTFAGTISARGGVLSGNGGEAEVSGKAKLSYTGFTDLSAANGRFGTLLLDPYNIIISNGADSGGFTATADDSVINATTLSNALGGANVTVTTGASGSPGTQDGNITVAAPVAWSAPTTLTLTAANAIAVNSTISVQGAGGVALNYNTASPTNLRFGNGASVDYGATNNSGTLSVNGQSYALVYSMADLANISSSGRSALATSLNSTTTYTTSVVGFSSAFSGTFEGLGHTISNLTINNTTPGSIAGLFGYVTGTIRDIGLVGGSITGVNQSYIGALVGYLEGSSSPASVVNSYSTATVTGGDTSRVGGLIGSINASGGATLVANSYSTGNVTTGTTVNQIAVAGGLVGYQIASNANATITGSYATGAVTSGGGTFLGGLLGYNDSSSGRTAAVVNSYATGAMGPTPGVAANAVGGLVGTNTTNGGVSSISSSFATGAVSVGSGNPGGNAAGGLVGSNLGQSTGGVVSIADSYATGAVRGAVGSSNGGLVGTNLGISNGTASIGTSYATGRVTTSGYGGTGGLVGSNQSLAGGVTTIASSYWDMSTSGIPTAGIGNDPQGQGTNVTGLTTAQFQSGTLPANFSSSVWATGAGLYPYLTGIFKNGVQAVSGFAYTDAGLTGLGSATVGVIANGSNFGSATTGANGYYYVFGAAGQVANGQNLLAYTGANNSATLASANGATAQANINLYGNAVTVPTTATTLTTAPTLAQAQQSALAASGGLAAAGNAINGASGLGLITSGASFTIDQSVNTASTLVVQTTASGAGITVSQPITLNGGSLGLLASGALAVNAPINANSAPVALGYDQNTTTPSATNLSFAIGAPLTFSGGGALAINGNPYTLISSMGDLPGLNGQSGRYALAGDLDASGNTYTGALIGSFSGTLEGLGHTISNLAVTSTTSNTGMIGTLNSGGTVRDIGLLGGNITVGYAGGQGPQSIGGLVGLNNGSVVQAYSTGVVNAGLLSLNVGGLVGQNSGVITRSFVGGSVAGYLTVGGMVGVNYGTITQSYATASVNGAQFGSGAGGFAGFNTGTITQAYATGTVSASSQFGGFTQDTQTGSITQSYWDTQTSGQQTGGGGAIGLTTAQFQSGSAAGLGSAFAGGANGLYPYLVNFYPNGVQAVSGTAPAAATTVSVIAGGASFGSVSSAANGYYYILGRAGSFLSGQSVLAYTGNAATLTSASSAAAQSGVDIYGSTLTAPTSATLLSVADQTFVSDAQTAANGNAAALNAIGNATGRYYQATGANFTIDGSGVSTNGMFGVRTTAANAGITVSAPITVNGSDALRLEASGALAINAPVTAFGGGQVTLAASFDTTTAQGVSLLNLSFGPGASIDYGATNFGGTLTINGQSYNLLYSMGDVATVNNALSGNYALATDLDAAGTTYTSAVIAPGLPYNAPVFSGTLTGLGHAIANLSISNTADQAAIGLVGLNTGTIRDLRLVGGVVATTGIANSTGALVGFNQGVIANVSSSVTVSGGIRADYIGGLVGFSDGSTRNVAIVNAAATGAVSATTGNIGGLVGLQQGRNGNTATIANSYATGAVSATFGNYAGGLVGISQAVDGGTAAITNSYSTGNVAIGGQTSVAGGLVGNNAAVRGGAVASLTNVYATGVVSVSGSQATAGALIGTNSVFDNGTLPASTTPIVNAYWDVTTSGRSNAFGSDNANQAGNVVGLTTRQLQGLDPVNSKLFDVTTDLGNGTTSAFAGGFGGNYAYLSSFFPTGVQVISGTAYADAGLTAAAPRSIGVIVNGTLFASASSGANGYYYAFGANGAITNGASLLTHNGVNAATLTNATGATIQSVNLYGNALTVDTTATSLAGAPNLVTAQGYALSSANFNAVAATAINNAGGQGFIASGLGGFTIDQVVGGANTFFVQTTAGGITVSQPITIASGGGGVGLLSSGRLAINAPVTINGAGTANLVYDASNPTNLSFAQGAPLTFTNADGSAASSAVNGQALAINGQGYGLLYNMGDVANVNGNLVGNFALATNIDASGTTYTTGVIAGGDMTGVWPTPFSGIFAGLGHTISNLTINQALNTSVGLIGYSTGVVRDIGIVGGSVAGSSNVGALVGHNMGLVANAYATATVTGNLGNLGGLVGYNNGGLVTNAYATGAVSGGANSMNLGGLIGANLFLVLNGYWDTQTSGQSTGIGSDTFGQTVAGLTTRQLQGLDPINGNAFSVVNNLGDGATSAFSGGANGLYPYLASFFPNGVQAVSGTVYRDAGATPLASGVNGAVQVGVIGNNAALGTATSGANGYYYVFGAAGTRSACITLLDFTVTNVDANGAVIAKSAATLTAAVGTSIETGVNIYGDALTISTTANALSAAPSLAAARTSANAAAGGNGKALSAIAGAQGRSFIATNGDFAIDQTITTANTFRVQTAAANAAITAASAITINDGGSLGLLASGALRVNARIAVNGAGSVNLAYDVSSPTNLSFAKGAPLTFANADGSSANSAVIGQALVLNGQTYTLLYNMSDVANVNGNLAGNYALATNLDASGNSYSTGVIAGGDFSGATPAAFSGVFEGLGHTVSNLTVSGVADGNNYIGLIGYSTGTVRDIGVASGSVAGRNYVGALVGQNAGVIANAYATSDVRGDSIVGGLAGYNFGTITQSYATGAVRGSYGIGGLVGGNAAGTISQSYATGAVSGPDTVGGLVGIDNNGTITQAYAIGAVSGSTSVGGLVGSNVNGTIVQAYWDVQTSGQANSIGTDLNNQAGNAIGLTTRQLQGLEAFPGGGGSVVNANNLGFAFAGGTDGLYPYLANFFPNGVQVVSGTAYNDAIGTPLASSANGAVMVNIVGGGSALGSATTGANGYYYAFGQPGTIADGTALLAYINANVPAGAKNSVTLTTASGTPTRTSTLQTGVDLYNGALSAPTSELTLSAARSAEIAPLNAALNQNIAALPAAVGAYAGGRYYTATGASFTIDTPVTTSNIFGVSTTTGAPLTVSNPITINNGGSLGLFSGGALAINAAVNVNGAGSVGLVYDTSSSTNLTFAQGRALTFANADGSAASAPVTGQSLAINGQGYTLLYSMADLDAIDGHNGVLDSAATAPIGPGGTGMTGRYALAGNFDAAGVTYIASPIRYDVNVGNAFSGVLEGLGHTISNLTVNDQSSYPYFTGVIGQTDQSAVIRDIGIVGGSITGQQYTGGLVGQNNGLIANASSTAAVTGTFSVGGLVGYNSGILTNVWTAGVINGNSYVGGLAGDNFGSITNAFSASYVNGNGVVGGLVGSNNQGSVTNAVVTGTVVGNGSVGGLVGLNSGPVANGYYDAQTTGRNLGIQADGSVGLTTAQLQSGAANAGLGSAFAGGVDGLYPYLASFFPNGVQAVSGFAYTDGGVTPLASGPNGPAYVSVASSGQTLGSVTTGANGYYYYFASAGTLTSSAGVAAYTQADANTGAADAVSYQSGTPDTVTRLDISGGWRRDTTSRSSLSALDAGFTATTNGTPVSGFTLPNRDIFVINDFALNSALGVTGTMSLTSVGTVTQTAALSAGTLLLEGRGFTLTNIGNQFGRLAASSEAINVFSATSLTIAASASNACGCVVTGVLGTGSVRIATAGDLTIEAGAGVSGDSPVLAAAGAFINNEGVKAVTATSGRWLVYSADSAGNTFGGLDSGNTAVWNSAAGAAVAPSGNRYAFAANRTLTVTTSNDSKTYGEDVTSRIATRYAITGFDPGLTGAYLADTAASAYTGAANVTSAGAAARANVVGSPYAITASLGSLASDAGYGFAFANSGLLTINPRAISVTADAQSRIFGSANPALTYSVGGLGLVNGDTLTGGLATSANTTSIVGNYAITQGTLAASPNYAMTFNNGVLTVTQTALSTIDVGVLASSLVRDSVEWIALPEGAVPLLSIPPIQTTLGTGVLYSDPRFDTILVCFGGGNKAATSCFAAGR